jgi:hypothetical protein
LLWSFSNTRITCFAESLTTDDDMRQCATCVAPHNSSLLPLTGGCMAV